MKKYLKLFALYFIALLIGGVAAIAVLWVGFILTELFDNIVVGVLGGFLLFITFGAVFEALGDEGEGGSR